MRKMSDQVREVEERLEMERSIREEDRRRFGLLSAKMQMKVVKAIKYVFFHQAHMLSATKKMKRE